MKKTARGFAMYADFNDQMGKRIRVQRSSLATGRCVWIFTDIQQHHVTGQLTAGSHLTVPQAKRVVKALQKFIDGK